MTAGILLSRLARYVSNMYSKDACRPGVITSFLASEGVWYASVCRYTRGPWGRRTIVAYTRHKNLRTCLRQLSYKVMQDLV